MELRRNIKLGAKSALNRSWGRAIAVLMIIAAVYLLISLLENICIMVFAQPIILDPFSTPQELFDDVLNFSPASLAITGGASLAMLMVLVPLSLGRERWYYCVVGGEHESLLSLFRYFSAPSHFFRAIGLSLLLCIKLLLWEILFVAPGAALIWFARYMLPGYKLSSGELLAGMGIFAGIALVLLGIIFFAIVSQRYFLLPYYLAEGRKIHDAFRESALASKGECTALLFFRLSFLGWALLCFFVLPLLYVDPYYSASKAIYARYLIERRLHTPADATKEWDVESKVEPKSGSESTD